MKVQDLRPGDRVRFSSRWLQSVGAVTGPLGQLRGTVRSTTRWRSGAVIASIRWDGVEPMEPDGALASNLEVLNPHRNVWEGVGHRALP